MVNNKLSFLILSLVVLTLTNPLIVNASQVIDTMEKGNTFYREGEYEKAIDYALKVEDYKTLGAAYDNSGLCYFHKIDCHNAIKYWDLSIDAYSKEGVDVSYIEENIEEITEIIEEEPEPVPEPSIQKVPCPICKKEYSPQGFPKHFEACEKKKKLHQCRIYIAWLSQECG